MAIRVTLQPLYLVLGVGVMLYLFSHRNGPKEWKYDGSKTSGLSWREYRKGMQHEGSGERIRRFLEKASRGEVITVSVIGGSVSKGRGLIPAPELSPRMFGNSSDTTGHTRRGFRNPTLYSPENMHVLVFDWLNTVFPHRDHKFVNGAQGAVGAEYFGWCFEEHISEDADLVIVELGINDLVSTSGFSAYERLIRSVLEMKNKPAIINIETFTVLFSPIISSSAVHQDICAYYDIPSISIRDIVLPRILADPQEEIPRWFRTGDELSLTDPKVREFGGEAVDMMHISAVGHALAADLMIRYLSRQLYHSKKRWWKDERPEEELGVPATLLTGSFDPHSKIPISTPVCRSMNSAHMHFDHDGEAKGVVLAKGSQGWTHWSWKEKRYLTSNTPGAIAKFDFITSSPSFPPQPRLPDRLPPRILRPNRNKIQSLPINGRQRKVVPHAEPRRSSRGGTVALAYQRSKYFGLGRITCWVDNDEKNAREIDGYWDIEERNMGV